MKIKLLQSIVSSSILLFSTANACTTILVGSDATADQSQFIARTEDHDPVLSKVFLVHDSESINNRIFKANKNKFQYQLPNKAFKYTSFSDGDTIQSHGEKLTWGAAGFNEVGVGMTATETIFASDKALKNDPYLVDFGITEDSIVDVILPYITTAKDGVERLGKIIEEKGAGEGFGVAFIDKTSIWYLETGSAHQWVAVKLPKDKYFVTGNQGRIQYIKTDDKNNYLYSKELISYAIKNKLYDKDKDGAFNFEKAYVKHNTNKNGDTYYNYPRVYALQKLFSPNIKTTLSNPSDYLVFQTPQNKLTLNDVKAGLRNTYENIGRKPYTKIPDTRIRPISIFRTEESHILQTRKNLPDTLSNVEYISYGMPSISMYIPIYTMNITDSNVPLSFKQKTKGEADSISAQWKFRKLQSLVMLDYYKYAPIVQKEYRDEESKLNTLQKEMEIKYLKTYKNNPEEANKLLVDFQKQAFEMALISTDKLTNEIFSKLTKDINERYLFSGA
ncbi:C69 family dipeptidase [Providencia sp. Me31A]|uniref:C69 family dipeptidase n=1 Tax=Providencia sp. Me31A TaxID=3392637 RepID=UPI003D2DD8E9